MINDLNKLIRLEKEEIEEMIFFQDKYKENKLRSFRIKWLKFKINALNRIYR